MSGKVLFLMAVCVVCAAVLLPVSVWSRELFPGLYKSVLPNGLTGVVKVNSRAPVAAVQIWVKAGSSYETEREAGITHLIEHMIFKGTEKRGPGMIAREIESVGGSVNAYTSLDYTVYHCEVPSVSLDLALDVLSDAVFHSTFDPDELEREKKVVLEEISMREDRPQSRLSRILMENSYVRHSYRWPVIGFPETVMAFTRHDILSYMKRRYTPANISVVVSGDVDPEAAMKRIEDVFGGIPAGETIEEQVFSEEPPQEAPRCKEEVMEISEGHLALAFTGIPSFADPRVPALDVLAAVLGGAESSRLTLSLKNRLQIVHSIHASSFTPMGPGLFEVVSTLDPQRTREAVFHVLQGLYELKYRPVSEDELERAKILIESDFLYSQETMDGEARKAGMFETLTGDPAKEFFYLAKVRAVTPEDVKRAAETFFGLRNFTVSLVMPTGKQVALSVEDLTDAAIRADAEARKAAGPQTGADRTRIHREVLANGLTVLVQEAPEVPTVSVQLVFPGGVRYETTETNGIYTFLAAAWTKGTTTLSSQEFSEAIEDMGGRIEGFSGQNTFGLQGSFLSRDLENGLALFADVLLHPVFAPEELDKLRPILLSRLRSQEDNLASLAIREFRRLLFAPNPYALNPLGSEAVFRTLDSPRLLGLWRERARPDAGVITVVGDVSSRKIVQTLQRLLGSWSSIDQVPPPRIPAPAPLTEPKTFTLEKDKNQVHVVLGFPGVSFTSPDRFPLEVLNAVLAGQGGRLFSTLRDQESLAYSVTSLMSPGLDYGSFAFYIACAPEKKDAAIQGLWREIYRVIETPIPEEELTRAKNWLIGNHEIDLQTNGARALTFSLNDLYGLGYDFSFRYPSIIRDVKAEDVQRVAREVLRPALYVLVLVGP